MRPPGVLALRTHFPPTPRERPASKWAMRLAPGCGASGLAVILLLAAAPPVRPAPSEATCGGPTGAACRGIAVLSSSLGGEVTAEEILAFTDSCRINLVVIDFAWVTYHWPRTDLVALEKLGAALRRRGVD